MTVWCVRRLIKTALLLLILSTVTYNLTSPIVIHSPQRAINITVHVNPGNPLNTFTPSHALGGAIDGHEKGEIDRMLSPSNIKQMLSAGLGPISYRLRTELAGEAWHWNPTGTWSDAKHRQGYWISNRNHSKEVSLSYGYRLPRRGNTLDQANDDGYSRIDDGDIKSFWKSNPYLDEHFTGEANSRLPQWVLFDLGKAVDIDAIRIAWAHPFATDYEIQYGNFGDEGDISERLPDQWRTFPTGAVHSLKGGDITLALSTNPISTRFVRILMNESSHTFDRHSSDVRDRVGYALHEVYLGTMKNGVLHDELRHGGSNDKQTVVYASSTDPWHRESDKDELIEQSGFDRVFHSGLSRGLPVLVPVSLLYDTPENAAAEISFLKSRGYAIEAVELGEEPDGQFVPPEMYAALYIQFSKAIRSVDRELKLGGPSFQDIEPADEVTSPKGKRAWLNDFLTSLKDRGHLNDYNFFSFEWYPFDDVCKPTAPALAQASTMLEHSLSEMEAGGLTKDIPWIITEYGYSAFAGRQEIDIEGALLNADAVGEFLTLGGDQTFLYGYEPNELIQEASCSVGNNMLFLLNDDGTIRSRMATYYTAQLVTQEWTKPGDELHELYAATVPDGSNIAAYAVHRPDALWSLMLINKSPAQAQAVAVQFKNQKTGTTANFEGVVEVVQYSRKQYQLSSSEAEPMPEKNEPPEHRHARSDELIELPPYSLTIVRGAVSQK